MTKYRDDRDPKVIAMLKEIVEVCKKHGMSLGHEDAHGGFLVEPWDDYNEKWLLDAGQVEVREEDPISDEAMKTLKMLNDIPSLRFYVPEEKPQPDHVVELRTLRFISYVFSRDERWIVISDAGREYLRSHA
jgi:hypothetical protein